MKNSKTSVLIVDDHAVVAEGLQLFLENAGFEVIGRASSGRQAVELVQELTPLVVLLDIVMPDMDGLEALAGIKEVQPETIVIMVTAANSLDSMAQAVALGAAGASPLFISSPGAVHHWSLSVKPSFT